MISPRTQKKRLLALADQLEAGSDLTPEQRAYLVACFRAMGHGEDGNSAFGLSYTPGRSKSDEERRENLRLIFSWIMTAISPESEYGLGYSLTEAIDKAYELSQQAGTPFKPMERDSIASAWDKEKYKYLKSLEFRSTDLHSPMAYETPPET